MLECYTCHASGVTVEQHEHIQELVEKFDEFVLDDFLRRLGLWHCIGKAEHFHNDCAVTCKECFNGFVRWHNVEEIE